MKSHSLRIFQVIKKKCLGYKKFNFELFFGYWFRKYCFSLLCKYYWSIAVINKNRTESHFKKHRYNTNQLIFVYIVRTSHAGRLKLDKKSDLCVDFLQTMKIPFCWTWWTSANRYWTWKDQRCTWRWCRVQAVLVVLKQIWFYMLKFVWKNKQFNSSLNSSN